MAWFSTKTIESTTDCLLREAAENQIQKETIEQLKRDQVHQLLASQYQQSVISQYGGTQGYGGAGGASGIAGQYAGSHTITQGGTVWSNGSPSTHVVAVSPHDKNIEGACELIEIARINIHDGDINRAIVSLSEAELCLRRYKLKMTTKPPSQPTFTLDEIEQAKQFMEDIAAKRFVPEPEEADAKT